MNIFIALGLNIRPCGNHVPRVGCPALTNGVTLGPASSGWLCAFVFLEERLRGHSVGAWPCGVDAEVTLSLLTPTYLWPFVAKRLLN